MRCARVAIALILLLAACGSGDDSASTTDPPEAVTTSEAVTTTEPVTTTEEVPATSTAPGQVVVLWFASENLTECSNVASVERIVAADADPMFAAFELLVAGPLPDEEADGFSSMFSDATAGTVRSVTLVDGLLTVDFDDFSAIIPNASTSCGSMSLIAQLNWTARGFGAESATYTFEGSCERFFNWLQSDCQQYGLVP